MFNIKKINSLEERIGYLGKKTKQLVNYVSKEKDKNNDSEHVKELNIKVHIYIYY